MKPWSGENAAARITRPLRHNGTPYSGINILMLWAASVEYGFNSPSWMTFKQADLSAHVRKGEKGSLVVYANTFTRTEEDAEGQEIEREIPFLKGYTVFNVEQIEACPSIFTSSRSEVHRRAAYRTRRGILRSYPRRIRYRGRRAYYAQDADYIQMPPIESFRDAESFYSTPPTNHALTKHPSRVERRFRPQELGADEGYAREETRRRAGRRPPLRRPRTHRGRSATTTPPYIATWYNRSEERQPRGSSAAAHAQRAVDYLHKLQPEAH